MTTLANALAGVSQPLPLQRILLIEKDKAMQAKLEQLFECEGYGVETATSTLAGQRQWLSAPPSVLLLNAEMADISPHGPFEQLRLANPHIPIIVLGASSSVMEKVLFLELGADDFVVKPFNERELLARVRAAIRRPQAPLADVVSFGDVRVDFFKMEVRCQGELVPLTAQEFKVLKFMTRNPERVISREELLNEAWGYRNYPSTRTVDNHILKLRQKLERRPSHPVHFLTIYCVGYKFLPHADEMVPTIRQAGSRRG